MLSSIKYPREWSRVASGKLVLNAEESLTITDTNDMSSGKKVKLYSKSSIFFITIFHPQTLYQFLECGKTIRHFATMSRHVIYNHVHDQQKLHLQTQSCQPNVSWNSRETPKRGPRACCVSRTHYRGYLSW